MDISPIAKIYTDYTSKFGIPRQSGLVNNEGRIVFEPSFRNRDALRGLESFSHIWLIWQFSENICQDFSPTVRPPRLGGNTRIGVFATRSPFRPNNLGLSCVQLKTIDYDCKDGPTIVVLGADIMNGTPIYDIKPYIPYSDCICDAVEGFASKPSSDLSIVFDDGCDKILPPDKVAELTEILSLDPRPHYHDDGRIYGMELGKKEIKFRVINGTLHVLSILAK